MDGTRSGAEPTTGLGLRVQGGREGKRRGKPINR